MSIALLERAAAELGPLVEEVAFVGGATVVLWITDPAAPEPRPTKDVDVVVEVTTRVAWHDFEERLRRQGFREDSSSRVICRWRSGDGGEGDLILDAMPAEARLVGFENRWQAPGLAAAVERALPSGASIRAIPPPFLAATKLEAWKGRGGGDHLGSADLEDVVALVDGRVELVDEVAAAPEDVRSFLSTEITALLGEPRFLDAVYGFVSGPSGERRVDDVVLPRLRGLIAVDDAG